MQTYKEMINRYRVLRHEELPEEHKAHYRAEGINPDDNWSLIWSFTTREAAEKCIADYEIDKPWFYTYKLVDAGQSEVIDRPVSW